MRSFITFIVCTGFIVWAHSCDKRIVGVKIYGRGPEEPSNTDGFSQIKTQSPVHGLLANAAQKHNADSVSNNHQDILILR